MSYVTQLDVEAFSGFGYMDFKQGSVTMSASQWKDYCENDLIPRIEQMVHRYCGVSSFVEHTVIEYFDSPSEPQFLDQYMGWMTPGGPMAWEQDTYEFILPEPCLSVASVEIKPNPWVDEWDALIEVGSYQGDYYTATQAEVTHVYVNNIPPQGHANIRITYQAGYKAGSPQFREIQLIVLRIIRINLEEKMKFQQAGTIRNVNVRDYTEMFDLAHRQKGQEDVYYIPQDIVDELNRYRRLLIGQML